MSSLRTSRTSLRTGRSCGIASFRASPPRLTLPLCLICLFVAYIDQDLRLCTVHRDPDSKSRVPIIVGELRALRVHATYQTELQALDNAPYACIQ